MGIQYYIMRLKCLFRDKENWFWTFTFPVVLATLFHFAFTNIGNQDVFETVKIAVVKDEAYGDDMVIRSALQEAQNNQGDKLFEVFECSKKEAENLLIENKVSGYITTSNHIKLTVLKSGISQTIIKSFLDTYNQVNASIQNIISKEIIQSGFQMSEAEIAERVNQMIKVFTEDKSFIQAKSISNRNPDTVLQYFYALIAMACLFGTYMGFAEIVNIQADQSAEAARLNVAPVHKMKLLLCNLSAAFTVQLIGIFILLLYLNLVLKVQFGDQIGYILLICVLGCSLGITIGSMITLLVKKDRNFKRAILSAVAVAGSFFAGLMIVEAKYAVSVAAPWFEYINPASLISDAFYSLYYYDDLSKYFTNISLMAFFTLLYGGITYLIARRQQYASI